MTKEMDALFGATSKLSPAVRKLGYTGSPLPLDEWLKLQAIIVSTQTASGLKRVALPPVIVSCEQCGATCRKEAFEVRKHIKRGHKAFFCSNACWGRATNVTRFGARVCARCGENAPKRTSKGARTDGRVFCSKTCLLAERQEELETRALMKMKPCVRCNTMFLPQNAAVRFCGRECASRVHAAAMAGEGNPRWKDGVFASRVKPHVTRRFRELRPMVMRRDGECCVLCQAVADLQVHHIDENPLNNRVSNLVTLCRSCHMKTHFSAQSATLSAQLKTYAEKPMSTTFKWKERSASSPTVS